MSATATKKTKHDERKSGSKKPGISEKKAAANKRNSEKSTGPRTADGKERSKHNALKHGLTARSALLPGEDPAGLNALRCELLDGLQPCNALESTLIVRIAEDKWITDRAEQAASRRVAERLRHEPLEQAQRERDEALELGECLFWNLARPLPFDASSQNVLMGEPEDLENGVDPWRPARVRLRLEKTVAGCDWLLDRWEELNLRLRLEDAWLASDAFKMVRLMGKHAVDMEEDFNVARLLMSSLTVIQSLEGATIPRPANWPGLLTRMLASFDFEGREHLIEGLVSRFTSYMARLVRLPLERMAPESVPLARQWLTKVIDAEIRRVQTIRTALADIAATDAAEAPIRLWLETGPEAENHRRYALSNKRVLNRSVSNFLLARKQSEAGAFDLVEVAPGDRPKDGETRLEEGANGDAPARANDAQPPRVETPPAGCEDQPLFATPDSEVICDDQEFLRNEPISVEESAPKPPAADTKSSSPTVVTLANGESHTNPKRERGSLSTAAIAVASGSTVVASGSIAVAPDSNPAASGSLAVAPDSNPAASGSIAVASETNVDTTPTLPHGLKELSSSLGTPPALIVPIDGSLSEPRADLPPSHDVAPGVRRAASVESPAPSVDEKASCGDGQFLRNEPTAVFVRNSDGHQADKQTDQTPHHNDKKVSPAQLRVMRLERWKENKIRELKEAGWTEPFSTGIP